ncbi:hypothetical protein N0K08_06445 [Acidovorax sp. Be4]|uniref:Tetratricopeptide repeat protein n=1 Tax=Acidovorax bellezanensis TaxID=2976702 RepID=A0ABT2PMC1_9BURK|nr:hypothetical protein [Acidovorax sp. Be4]MCT9810263.1 hypothetical protein [Acidovorax sp. Be4]
MNSPRSTASLQGDALHAFLEQAHDLLNDDQDDTDSSISREDRMAAVIELMEQQTFAPANVTDLERLHDFWLFLDRPETANDLLQTHRQAALQAGDRHPDDARARLALSDIQSRLEFDKPSAIPLLLPAAQAIASLPENIDATRYWHGWEWMANQAQAWEIAETGVDLRRARERHADEDHAARNDAMALARKAELAHQRADAGAAARHVQAAIDTLHDAAPEQEVDFDQWMDLADRALPVATASLPALLMACERQLARTENPPPSPAVQAHRQVRIMRLQAHACALAGQLEAALQLAPQGRLGLTDDEGDPFSALVMQWLVQADRLPEAATLALESVLHARPVSSTQGYHLARERFGNDAQHAVTWALILAMAQTDPDMRQLLAQESRPDQPADFYLDFVRAIAPHHPVLALTLGMRHAAKRQMDQALPLLEQSVGLHPHMADGEKLAALWAARFAALPLEEALARPFVLAHGAHWCYAVGVVLDDEDDLGPLMGGKKNIPSAEVRAPLVLRYYEEGLARFEQFWATGQGAFKDADLHVYSMLCNNLAIKYRFLNRYDEAVALHHKGLASSPFGEHLNGLMWSAIGKDDDDATVAAAERLWHFAQDHSYGRHDPTRYFSTVALSLFKLDRDDEISIWLERLDQWYEDLDAADQRSERRDYLASLMSMLDFFSSTRPELVLPRLRAHQDEVRALKESYTLRRLGCALEAYPELLEESVAMHKESAGYLGKNDDDDERNMSRTGIARAERKLAERDQPDQADDRRKPWWKFW